MKKLKFFLLCAAVGLVPGLRADEVMLDIPPHIYTGRVLDSSAGNLATSSRQAEVRARKADGTLLARSPVRLVQGEIVNYSLNIPMNLSGSKNTATRGERLTFEVDNGKDVFQIQNAFPPVGSPGRVTQVNLVAAKDENRNGFADEFERDLATYMAVMGMGNQPLTKNGDLDGDGMSNYDEYLAGTDLLSADDKLKILSFDQVSANPDVFKLTFISAPNRAYAVQATTNLVQGAASFATTPHRQDPSPESQSSPYLQTGPEFTGASLLYLIREDESAFYRVNLE